MVQNITCGLSQRNFLGPRVYEWERDGSVGTPVRAPEFQERASESLKGHIALATDFILISSHFWGYFQLFLVYLEKYLCKIHLDFWIMVVDHPSHLHCNQRGHHYIIWHMFTIFQFKSSILREADLFRLAKFILETQAWTFTISVLCQCHVH